ncbi:RNA polymerase sigma factor [Rhodohalobacter mucosus]|nr:sigma-70 family RNA polymerase sigma factor [Rhodohalobacter mucosus]
MSVSVKNNRVDYSVLVNYLQVQETRKANELLAEVLPKLVQYLQITVGANPETAEECVQQAFLNVYERILQDKIRDPKSILSYLMQASRNEYFSHCQKNKRYTELPETEKGMSEPAEQISRLVDDERMEALSECISRLDDESREFITYFMDNPGVRSRQVATEFGISEANVRIKKHRIVHQLQDMYKKMTADV